MTQDTPYTWICEPSPLLTKINRSMSILIKESGRTTVDQIACVEFVDAYLEDRFGARCVYQWSEGDRRGIESVVFPNHAAWSAFLLAHA